jgi:hypothetical protein
MKIPGGNVKVCQECAHAETARGGKTDIAAAASTLVGSCLELLRIMHFSRAFSSAVKNDDGVYSKI